MTVSRKTEPRNIRSLMTGKPVIEGAGVHLTRVFGFTEAPMFDPFLMLDDFRCDDPAKYRKGFPWHPHRGIETITYVLKGDVEHGDSLGNKGVIGSGDVQWMTAGSGIIHQEMPKGDGSGSMHGFQLWANLPASQKMTRPRYRGITADRIPAVTMENGVLVKVIAGSLNGAKGPMDDIAIHPEYFDCSLPPHAMYTHQTIPDYTALIYVIGGKGRVSGTEIADGMLVLFDQGPALAIESTDEGMRFLLLTGRPLGEPVAWQGPIVMNTQAELETAFREYREGTFIK